MEAGSSRYWRFRPIIKPEQEALFEKENTIMAIDMKDPENVRRFSELFIKKKTELSPMNMSPEMLLDHIKGLESSLEILIFESRAEIQGARDFMEEALKHEKADKVKAIREKDKAAKYRPSLNQLEASQKQAKKAAAKDSKAEKIASLMDKYKINKIKADLIYGFIKLGMDEDGAVKTAGC